MLRTKPKLTSRKPKKQPKAAWKRDSVQEIIILECKISILNSARVTTEGMRVKEAFLDYGHTEQYRNYEYMAGFTKASNIKSRDTLMSSCA